MASFNDWLQEPSKQKLLLKLKSGIKVRRGIRPKKAGMPFSSDPGDFGRGIYYSTDWNRARSYADKDNNVHKSIIKFENPLVLTSNEAYDFADKFHTVKLPDDFYMSVKDNPNRSQLIIDEQLKNAQKMTDYFVNLGYDGLAVVFTGNGQIEIVDYRK